MKSTAETLAQMPGETATFSEPYERLTGSGPLYEMLFHKGGAVIEDTTSRSNKIKLFTK